MAFSEDGEKITKTKKIRQEKVIAIERDLWRDTCDLLPTKRIGTRSRHPQGVHPPLAFIDFLEFYAFLGISRRAEYLQVGDVVRAQHRGAGRVAGCRLTR